MKTIEDLEAEVARLRTELIWAREQASQASQAALEAKSNLRDTFALAALSGIVANVDALEAAKSQGIEVGELIYDIADKMLAARTK